MLTRFDIQRILKLLKQQVYPTVGGTELTAVALAVCKARELLGGTPDSVTVKLSGTVIKNAMGMGIPGTSKIVGIPAAIALGVYSGESSQGLTLLDNIPAEAFPLAHKFVAEKRYLIKHAVTFELIYIEVLAIIKAQDESGEDKVAKVVIAQEPDKFVVLKVGDETILDESASLRAEHDRSHGSDLSMAKIYEFGTKTPLDELQFLLKAARKNKDVAQMAFLPEANYGLNLGKMLKGGFEERMVGVDAMSRVVCYTSAATDVRMSGARIPIVTNCGSGAQGIAVSLPVLIFAEETQCTEAKLCRALAISNLTNIYMRELTGRLSSHCSCVVACTGAAAGIAYLMGGSYETVCMAVKNQIASKTGMICDGAKPSCTLKMSSAVAGAFQSAMMAMENIVVANTDGIIEEDVDKSIDNMASIGRDFKHEMDSLVLTIMTEKE